MMAVPDISGVLGDGFSSGTDDTKAYKLTVAVGDTDALFAMEASGDVGWVA